MPSDYDKEKKRKERQFASIFIKGFDACLIGTKKNENPYTRKDFHETWRKGWERCNRGESFPSYLLYKE